MSSGPRLCIGQQAVSGCRDLLDLRNLHLERHFEVNTRRFDVQGDGFG